MANTEEAALAALRERYASAAATTVAAFERLAQQLETAPDAVAIVTALRHELHRVHGTVDSAGFAEAGRLAASMETVATRWLDDPSLDRERRGAVVMQFAKSLRESLTQPGGMRPGASSGGARLLLVGLPDDIASGLIAEGMSRGLRVERVTRASLAESVETDRPSAIILADEPAPAGVADGVPRVLLVDASAEKISLARVAGQRVLDSRVEPKAILDAVSLLQQVSGPLGGSVVVVDDDPVVLTMLKMLLERDGFRVVTRGSAHGFLAAVRNANPLLLVCDVDLPKSSGIELAMKIRNESEFADLPILMLTGRADSDTRSAAFSAGADDYMVKPLVPAEFQQRVGRLLETRRQRRATGGLHESTGMSLRARTMREIEALLRGPAGRARCVCVVRPAGAPADPAQEAAWHAESARLARAIRATEGFGGLLDASAIGGVLGCAAPEALALLSALAANAPSEAPAWNAGVAAQDPARAQTPRALIDFADAACVGARETGVTVRLWDPDDSDVAPDVIVVEDDDELAEMELFALDARGLSCRRFSTGPSALDAMLRMRVHGRRPIVLLEVDLPGLNGHSLHERLRVERPNVFDVVFLSVHSSEAEQLRALESGALDYVTKPLRMRVLMAKIASWRARAAS